VAIAQKEGKMKTLKSCHCIVLNSSGTPLAVFGGEEIETRSLNKEAIRRSYAYSLRDRRDTVDVREVAKYPGSWEGTVLIHRVPIKAVERFLGVERR
jgi:hypothetical protein